jgi:hypothetical protein
VDAFELTVEVGQFALGVLAPVRMIPSTRSMRRAAKISCPYLVTKIK